MLQYESRDSPQAKLKEDLGGEKASWKVGVVKKKTQIERACH